MASGKTHDAFSRACAFFGSGAALSCTHLILQSPLDYSLNIAAAAGAFVGGMTGLILSPDLDLVNRRGGGCMALIFWRALGIEAYWQLYGKLPHHSPLSHWPILGTLGRLAYCAPLWAPFVWALSPYSLNQLIFFGAFILNLMSADMIHWFLDGAPWGTGNRYLLRMR